MLKRGFLIGIGVDNAREVVVGLQGMGVVVVDLIERAGFGRF